MKLLLITLSIPKTIFENPKKPSNLYIGRITMEVINNIADDDIYYARESAFNKWSQELCILFGDQNGNITPELLNIQTDTPTTYLKSKKSTHSGRFLSMCYSVLSLLSKSTICNLLYFSWFTISVIKSIILCSISSSETSDHNLTL